MKIKVTPEGREGMWLVKPLDMIAWLRKQKMPQIHNYLPGPVAFIGADWSKKAVIRELRSCERAAVLTGEAQRWNRRHALSVIISNELKMFDIGPITEDDLEVVA